MKTKNLIQMNANVIKITNLKKGDAIKILKKEYGDTYKTCYGVVIDLLNTGDESFIQILKYETSYNSINAEIKTFAGSQDLDIFPATIEEVSEHMENTIKSIEDSIKEDKENLHKKIEGCNKAREFVSGEMSKKLSVVSFEEFTQDEFECKKELQNEKIKKLQDSNDF